MIASPLAALVRCVRVTRRAIAPAPLTGLTMEQTARILAPRPRIVRRAVAIGCPAAVLPTAAVPPVVPLPVPPAEVSSIPLPLPFGIGSGGPLLPPVLPGDVPLPVQLADVAAAVPEPTTLSLLLVGLFLLAVRRVL